LNDLDILVIIGSTRPVRIGEQVSTEIARLTERLGPVRASVEDLAVRALPLLDEPQPPAMGGYVHQHSRDWSLRVSRADAVVFVTPEYNAGYPAPLKNAIDYLYTEWRNKPALVISYGSRGGPRVQKQLAEVAGALGMRTTAGVQLSLSRSDFGPSGRLVDPERTIEPHHGALTAALTHLIATTADGAAEAPEAA